MGDEADGRRHWDDVYDRRAPDELSWYQPHLERSLELIEHSGLAKDAAIIDVGGGASTLVDDLLARGYTAVSVLDLSANAIAGAKRRLGARAERVTWIVGDITQIDLGERAYDFWHDRAVFHFLRGDEARARYVAAASRALRIGGRIVVATFGPAGPERCSGLDVTRYSADEIHARFGGAFRKLSGFEERHRTPGGTEQEFVYCYCRLGEPSPSG